MVSFIVSTSLRLASSFLSSPCCNARIFCDFGVSAATAACILRPRPCVVLAWFIEKY
jgi:hypothetical protein